MDTKGQEELLIRIDERTQTIHQDLREIVEHQKEQNGHIEQCLVDISSHGSSIKSIKWIIGIGSTVTLAIAGVLASLLLGN